MKLNKIKIGEFVKIIDERNSYGIKNFQGININKEFMPTVANTDNLDEKKYKVVRKNQFVYSGMQTGRDQCIRISLYTNDNPIIVSPAYTIFEITNKKIVLPEYFFMIFLSSERDRLGWFYSDSSIRSNLDWDRFCEIELELPSIDIQNKYVKIYKVIQENQKVYEKGLDDLKLVCDGFIEDLRRNMKSEEIAKYIDETNEKNIKYNISNIRGVNSRSEFCETKADTNGLKLDNYKIVHKNEFAYNPSRINLGSIALRKNENCIVSPMYITFKIIDKSLLLPEYLMMWYLRSEFQRSTLFYATGSVRDTFSFDVMKEVKIPIPKLEIQQDIVNIYNSYITRKEINEKLKDKIKELCPILIKGSIEEAKLS